MLKNFLYLDEEMLSGFLSSLEGGVMGTREEKSKTGGATSLAVDAKIAKASKQKTLADESSIQWSDNSHSKFERFESLAQDNPAKSLWIDVYSEEDMAGARHGSIINVNCELFIPQYAKVLAKNGGVGKIFEMLDEMESSGVPLEAMGLKAENMPTKAQRGMAGALSNLMGSNIAVIGDDFAGDWKIAASLKEQFIKNGMDDLEDEIRLVGQVKKIWRKGHSEQLVAMQGMSLMNRDDRRKAKKSGSSTAGFGETVEGPAVRVNVIAIYN
jgi:hypothetical protein